MQDKRRKSEGKKKPIRRARTLSAFLAFIVLLSVGGAQEASEDEAAWFPLQVGRRWVYQVTDAQGNTFTNERRVVEKKAIAGVDTFVFYEKLNNRALYLGFAGDELRLYGLASGENPTTIVTIASPQASIPLSAFLRSLCG